MKKRALVLGGGGTVGIAWETGVAAGLAENGINLSHADLFVGTSAGSVVGSLLAAGLDPVQLLAVQAAAGNAPPRDLSPLDPEGLQAIFMKWWSVDEVTPELRRELGAMALSVRTMPEEDWLAGFTQLLGGMTDWPVRHLLLTAVDAATGDLKVWDKSAGVPLHQAVASSCTVPGLFPPVSINGARYVDGGVRSGTNADLVAGHDSVVIIAPLAAEAHGLGCRQMAGEIAGLQAGGSAVEAIVPDEEALAVFGFNMMDPSRAAPAAAEGLRQGRAAAQRLAAIWQ